MNLKKSKQAAVNTIGDGPEYFYEHRVLPQDDKRVKHEVGEYLHKHGLYDIKRLKIQQHLQMERPDLRTPTLEAISSILKEDYKLRYRKYDGATVHYKDPMFDEKRLWACRLLA